jgi:ribosome biogenesis GTPase
MSRFLWLVPTTYLILLAAQATAFVPCSSVRATPFNTRARSLVQGPLFASIEHDEPDVTTPQPEDERTLQDLGWQQFFIDQVASSTSDSVDLSTTTNCTDNQLVPARISQQDKRGYHILGGNGLDTVIKTFKLDVTVGDWLLLNQTQPSKSVVLKRKSLMKRKAPGKSKSKIQLIAANLDTVFLVTSCSRDFKVARLERYIASTFEAGANPVIVLTKADLCDETLSQKLFAAADAISESVPVVLLNARNDEEVKTILAPWCQPGQTVGFLGSSGVGKSTITNALCGKIVAATNSIREIDGRGRHTTTKRQLYFLPNHCTVLDTPGMRELQLVDMANGLAEVFSDLVELSSQCRFRDCQHETEPGCALHDAIDDGSLGEKRFYRWKKLTEEEAANTELTKQAGWK